MSAKPNSNIVEFACPHCAETNTLSPPQTAKLNIELTVTCEHCNCDIEVIVAKGLKERFNVIISDKSDPTLNKQYFSPSIH